MNAQRCSFAVGLLAALTATFSLHADPLDNWHLRHRQEPTYALYGVAHGDSAFVAVGLYGAVLSSADGMHWTNQNAGSTTTLNSIAYGNGLFAAVAYSGVIVTSGDGASWSRQMSGTAADLFSVIFANGLFVATGYQTTNAVILTSPDGMTWTQRSFGTNLHPLTALAYGAGTFVVSDESTIMTSLDGITWTIRGATGPIPTLIAYGNGAFAGVRGNAFLTSPDGANWTQRDSRPGAPLNSLHFGEGRFVAAGEAGRIVTTPDGLTWTEQSFGSIQTLYGVTSGNGTLVVVGGCNVLLTSPDGVTWTDRGAKPFAPAAATFGGGTFVAVGSQACSRATDLVPVLTSIDGVNWVAHSSGTSNGLSSVAYGNGTFVAVGGTYNPDNGTIVTSTDGVTFQAQNLPEAGPLDFVAYGNGTFVATGSRLRRLATSADGFTWVTRDSPILSFVPTPIIFANGIFVGVKDRVYTSSDGVTWTSSPPVSTVLSFISQSIAYGDGQFVVVGSSISFQCGPNVWTSTNLNSWEPVGINCLDSLPPLTAVAYGNGQFVAFGPRPEILTSSDGRQWHSRTSQVFNGSWSGAIAFGRGTFVIAAPDDNAHADAIWGILQSDDTRPFLSGARDSASGHFEVSVSGGLALRYRLQAATSLPSTDWIDLLSFTNTAPATNFVDTSASNFVRRFYRIVSP